MTTTSLVVEVTTLRVIIANGLIRWIQAPPLLTHVGVRLLLDAVAEDEADHHLDALTTPRPLTENAGRLQTQAYRDLRHGVMAILTVSEATSISPTVARFLLAINVHTTAAGIPLPHQDHAHHQDEMGEVEQPLPNKTKQLGWQPCSLMPVNWMLIEPIV